MVMNEFVGSIGWSIRSRYYYYLQLWYHTVYHSSRVRRWDISIFVVVSFEMVRVTHFFWPPFAALGNVDEKKEKSTYHIVPALS